MQIYIFYILLVILIPIYIGYVYLNLIAKSFKHYIFPKLYETHDSKFIDLVISKFFLKSFEFLAYVRYLLVVLSFIVNYLNFHKKESSILIFLISSFLIIILNLISLIISNTYKKNKIIGFYTFTLLSRFFQLKEKFAKYLLPLKKVDPINKEKIIYNITLRALQELIKRGTIQKHTYTMIHSLMRMELHTIRNIMVPRTNIISIDQDKTLNQAISLANRSGFSRIPIINKNVDDIVGIFYLKDVVYNLQNIETNKDWSSRKLESIMRKPLFIPYSQNIVSLLESMQKQHVHMAIILDEYGGTEGIITIEDILEEIVGEIEDEYDLTPNVEPIIEVKPNKVKVLSTLPLVRLSEFFPDVNLNLDSQYEIDTVWALMAFNLKMVPIKGSSVLHEGLKFSVQESYGRKNQLLSVLIERVPSSSLDP